MTIKKTLGTFLLAGTIATGSSGCVYNHEEYNFGGEIEGKKVFFEDLGKFFGGNKLVVRNKDGSYVIYNGDDDFKLKKVMINDKLNSRIYKIDSKDPRVKKVIEDAQKEYDEYLVKIHKINTAPLYQE